MVTPDSDEARALVEALADELGRTPEALLQVLVRVQHRYHWVPPAVVEEAARILGVTPVRVRGVVSFYSFLSDRYQGDVVIHLSDNITDQMKGSRALAGRLCARLGVALGQTRADGRVSVHLTSCTGMADQGPAGLVDYRPVTRLDEARIDRIAALVEAGTPVAAWPAELFEVKSQVRRSDVGFREAVAAGEALGKSLARGGEPWPAWHDDLAPEHVARHHLERGGAETLQELHRSELRGRGGAGFRTAIKWESVRNANAAERYVLCNADEGEPGTFKDRVLLTEYADMVFEGMTICAHVIGARRGVLYLRQEYHYLGAHLEAVLARRRAQGLLGREILGTALEFEIAIHYGAGAYIAGMETAMIKSIEGRRAIPRRRWPLPVHQGYMRQPTVVNNVETFAAATAICARGAAWFTHAGTAQSTGTKLLSVSGDVERPGLYEYPWGVSVREVLRDAGGLGAQAVQVGGPSGTLLKADEIDRAIAFESGLGNVGTIMVFGPERDVFEVVKSFARFFQHESCGLCTPCRIGTTMLADYVAKFERGHGSPLDLEEMRRIGTLMDVMSHCGLGQSADNHVLESIVKFPEMWRRRMQTRELVPAFDLDGALAEARELTGRSDAAAHLKTEEG